MKKYEAYGLVFSDERKRLGKSQQEMAELLGISKGYLSKIESSYQPPSEGVCERLEVLANIRFEEALNQKMEEGKGRSGQLSTFLQMNPLMVQEEVLICWRADLIKKREELERMETLFHKKLYEALDYYISDHSRNDAINKAYIAYKQLMDDPNATDEGIEKAKQELTKKRVAQYQKVQPNMWTPREAQQKRLRVAFLKAEIATLEEEIDKAQQQYNQQVQEMDGNSLGNFGEKSPEVSKNFGNSAESFQDGTGTKS